MTAPIPPQKTAYSAAAAEDAILVFVRGRATYTTCRAFGEFLEAAPASSGTILQAHETLMAANPENVARFKDVVAFMREDLKKDVSEERS